MLTIYYQTRLRWGASDEGADKGCSTCEDSKANVSSVLDSAECLVRALHLDYVRANLGEDLRVGDLVLHASLDGIVLNVL